MMRSNAKAIGLGAGAGIVFGTITALAFMLLIPEVGFSYWEVAALPSLLTWSLFMGFLPGAVLGGVFGAAACALHDHLRSRRGRAGFTAVVVTTTVVVTQGLLPISWPLPRFKIGLLIGLLTLVSASVSLRLVLKHIR
jgi:hypothetical protein